MSSIELQTLGRLLAGSTIAIALLSNLSDTGLSMGGIAPFAIPPTGTMAFDAAVHFGEPKLTAHVIGDAGLPAVVANIRFPQNANIAFAGVALVAIP
jgi:hypothetical protein